VTTAAQAEPDFDVPAAATTPPRGRTSRPERPAAVPRPSTRPHLALVHTDEAGQLVIDDPSVVLVGLSEIKDLFNVTKGTVYRWHTARYKNGPALPPELVKVSRTSQWPLEEILTFAAERGHKPKPAVLARIRREQGQ
jgi:hypothetical protein